VNYSSVIKETVFNSVKDEYLLSELFEDFLPGELSMMETINWKREFEHILKETENNHQTLSETLNHIKINIKNKLKLWL
jgi:ferritin-like metal-binding protein YciE